MHTTRFPLLQTIIRCCNSFRSTARVINHDIMAIIICKFKIILYIQYMNKDDMNNDDAMCLCDCQWALLVMQIFKEIPFSITYHS